MKKRLSQRIFCEFLLKRITSMKTFCFSVISLLLIPVDEFQGCDASYLSSRGDFCTQIRRQNVLDNLIGCPYVTSFFIVNEKMYSRSLDLSLTEYAEV